MISCFGEVQSLSGAQLGGVETCWTSPSPNSESACLSGIDKVVEKVRLELETGTEAWGELGIFLTSQEKPALHLTVSLLGPRCRNPCEFSTS